MRKSVVGAAARVLLLLLLLVLALILTASRWILSAIALMIVLPLISWGLNFYVRNHIKAGVTMPTTIAKNTAVPVTVELRNDSLLPVLKAFCTLRIHNDLTGEERTVTLSDSVGAGQRSSQSFLLESEFCGQLHVPVSSVTLMDCFGLLPVKARVEASARMTVLPDLFPVEAEISARTSDQEEGSADRKGEDRSEVFQLREYQPGDDVRQIHWKLSSKLDEMILKEPSAPQSRSVMVFWDKRFPGTPAQMDTLAEAVSSVCQGILEGGMPFRLCWTEGEELMLSEVADDNELLLAIPALVKTVGVPECRLPDMEEYSSILYFTSELPETGDLSRIHVMLCSDSEESHDTLTVFSPQDYREVLQRLEM